jgi:GNAT superfamily N-acetyltransferase
MLTSTPNSEFKTLKECDDSDFEAFFELYEEALPENERKSRQEVGEMLMRPDYSIVVLKVYHQVVSFAIVFTSLRENVGLLEYMATLSALRNKGIGAAMFQKAAQIAARRPMLIEIDSDREESPDREIRTRRKTFYLRQGCRIIPGLDYRMPQFGATSPPLMELGYYWPDASEPLTPRVVDKWLSTIYNEVYQRQDSDSNLIQMKKQIHAA